ncbi:MAG: hypothetical protein PUG04_08610 [Lachnospiraceae bacterium]|nr:hypothetical protein [Lachnospiraceae bacterium]
MRIKRILAGMLAAVTIIAGSIPASGLQAEAATNWSVYSDDYFYNKMNASEKKLYSEMTSAARAKKKGRTTIKGTFRFADGTRKTVKISVRVK